MMFKHFIVTLTNGSVNHDYEKTSTNEREAIILAQAEAINLARGYELVKVREVEHYCYSCGRY